MPLPPRNRRKKKHHHHQGQFLLPVGTLEPGVVRDDLPGLVPPRDGGGGGGAGTGRPLRRTPAAGDPPENLRPLGMGGLRGRLPSGRPVAPPLGRPRGARARNDRGHDRLRPVVPLVVVTPRGDSEDAPGPPAGPAGLPPPRRRRQPRVTSAAEQARILEV